MSANFAPYQPPPDVPSEDPPADSRKSLLKGKQKRPWFNRDPSSYNAFSYQSGGAASDPASIAQSYSNDPEVAGIHSGFGNEIANAWETRLGWRVDLMAPAAYILGPVTALAFLIIETHNDYVRFHAYQSALLTTPLLAILLFFHLVLVLPSFLQTVILVLSVGGTGYAAFRAWKDAQNGLTRYYLPYVGEIAERWVGEE